MDNLMDLIFGIIYNDHDSDLIGRDQVDDYTIDTCLTADQGYETAVWVADHNMVIVARYATREEAVLGHPMYKHGSWCIKVTTETDGVTRSSWEIDKSIPLFVGEGREYIESLIQCQEE